MKDYVLDANAVLRYFGVGKAQGGEKVGVLFKQAKDGQARLFIATVNLGEIFYILLKYVGEQTSRDYVKVLQHAVTMVDADTDSALEAGSLKHRFHLGYADSFAAVLALKMKATLVSADPAFEKLGKSLKWLRLPPFEETAVAKRSR
jgi:predicted nucleic acid-binding protein